MKQKIFSIIVIFMLCLVLIACEPKDPDFLTDKDLRKGKDGVNVNFIENSPPKNVYENTNFNIGAKITNNGAYNANGYIVLTVEKDFVNITDNIKEYNLNGKSVLNPNGEMTNIIFNLESKTPGAQRTKHETTAILTTCYNYSTILSEDICIDPRVYSTTVATNKVCEFKDGVYKDQGSPVAITKISLMPESNADNKIKLRFNIDVENVGKGNVVDVNKIKEYCTSETIYRQDFGLVHIDEVTIGNYKFKKGATDNTIDCFEDSKRLINDKTTFRCEIKQLFESNAPEYTTTIIVKLKYGYTQSVSKSFFIERKI
jgi:hypothetical protein